MSWKTVKAYPGYVLSVFIGLLEALMITPEGVLFTFFGILLCWAIGVPLGLAIAVGLYTITFVGGQHFNGFMKLINSKFDRILQVISDMHGRS